ncbi:MAG: zinc-ribbon domain-containing protein [Chitinispirillales bacterium]|jgi:predicted nucleic acid-binding Zn ribbon protein|nr:zinc-ribbon domain-containing protein [Chitinispirillales bacterium]
MGKENGAYFVCPNCGAELPAGARVCSECGSDENTGWSESTYLDGIDLPFDDDDYEEVREREFGDSKKGFRINWMAVIGIVVLAAMFVAFVWQC